MSLSGLGDDGCLAYPVRAASLGSVDDRVRLGEGGLGRKDKPQAGGAGAVRGDAVGVVFGEAGEEAGDGVVVDELFGYAAVLAGLELRLELLVGAHPEALVFGGGAGLEAGGGAVFPGEGVGGEVLGGVVGGGGLVEGAAVVEGAGGVGEVPSVFQFGREYRATCEASTLAAQLRYQQLDQVIVKDQRHPSAFVTKTPPHGRSHATDRAEQRGAHAN